MSKTTQQNRNLLKKNSAFESRKEMDFDSKSKKIYHYKKTTTEQLKQVRTKTLSQNRRSKAISIILLTLFAGAVGYFMYYVMTEIALF